jgi:uncharacterized protein (TIGR03435 family)
MDSCFILPLRRKSRVSILLTMLQRITALLFLAVATVQPQTGPRPQFEVASIRPNPGNGGTSMGAGEGGDSEHNVTLKVLMTVAYRIQEFQISGGPSWAGSDRFDVEAKAADPKAGPDQVRLMLQSLLEDRFKLKLHRETRESSVYALVVDKGGLKMKPSADQTSADVDGPSPPGAGPNHGGIRIGSGSLIGNGVAMPLLVRMLSQRLDRTIVDKTDLTGRFDLQLQWTPDVGETPFSPGGDLLPPAADSSGISIFVALQEQLGLKLESQKGPVEMFVIDSVEKPSAN